MLTIIKLITIIATTVKPINGNIFVHLSVIHHFHKQVHIQQPRVWFFMSSLMSLIGVHGAQSAERKLKVISFEFKLTECCDESAMSVAAGFTD